MRGSKRRGPRRGRAAVIGAVAAGAVMAFGAGSAQAATVGFSATFDDAALNVSGLTFDILEPPDQATMVGTVDDGTGDFDVLASDFDFPPFSGEAAPGVPVTVNFSALDPIAGTLNPDGTITTDESTYHANVQALGGDCNYDVEMAFSTGPGGPFNGDPFTVSGTDPRVITNGILQTSWPANHFPPAGGSCGTINGLVNGGPGGLAMANGFDLTPAQPSGGTTTPPPAAPAKKKKCKKGFVKKKVKGKKKCVKKKKRK
jgi:hypothetical protein